MSVEHAHNMYIKREKSHVKWADVKGLWEAKAILEEHILRKLQQDPQHGQLYPKENVLLIGATGSGKSYLAQALGYAANDASFRSLSSSDILSSRTKGAELLERLLLEARQNSPCVVLLDDIEILFGSCGDDGSLHSVRQILLQYLSDRESVGPNIGITLLTTSSQPWMIDSQTMSLFTHVLHIPLPDSQARTDMFTHHMSQTQHLLNQEDFWQLGQRSEGFSPADITVVVRDAMMQPIRKLQQATHFIKVRGPSREDPNLIVDDLLTPCSPGTPGAIEMNWMQMEGSKLLEPVISMDDVMTSLQAQKPSLGAEEVQKYVDFIGT